MRINNKNGIALIVALIVAFLILALGSMALYFSMQSARISGGFRQYRSSIEAASGAFNEAKQVIKSIKDNSNISSQNLNDSKIDCMRYKISIPTNYWTSNGLSNSNCPSSRITLTESANINDVKSYYDLKYNLGNYIVYVKIVDTVEGNTFLSNSKSLTAGGVTTNKHGTDVIQLPPIPNLYRIEIVSESKINTSDKTTVSVLYGY